jgi:lipopolysaccharide/colanic/teichoic acid biosynthesis glycosyltransferase
MKRLFDLAAAAAGLVLLSPLFLAIAVAVKLTSRGPVVYRGRRTGRNGVPFDLFKFRSMAVSQAGAGITRAGDPRVTRVGRLLRRTKLDELPQLVNVLRGEMSLVGPRPEDPRYTALYDEQQKRVLSVRPGITGAASLEYRDEESRLVGDDWERTYVEEIMPAKLRLELAYLERASFATDLALLGATIAALLRR